MLKHKSTLAFVACLLLISTYTGVLSQTTAPLFTALEVSDTAGAFAVADDHYMITVRSIATGQVMAQIQLEDLRPSENYEYYVSDMEFNEDATRLYVGMSGTTGFGMLYAIDVTSGIVISTPNESSGRVGSLTLNEDDNVILYSRVSVEIANPSAYVHEWHLATNDIVRRVNTIGRYAYIVDWSTQNGNFAYRDIQLVAVENGDTGERIGYWVADENRLTSLAWSPSGDYLATTGASGRLGIWDANSFQLVRSIPLVTDPRTLGLFWGVDDTYAGIYSPDGDIIVANTQTGVVQAQLNLGERVIGADFINASQVLYYTRTQSGIMSAVPQPPTARAGDDLIATVGTNNTASVTLSGTDSTDADGTITTYSWSRPNTTAVTGAQPTVSLPAGTYTYTLTVTDDDGLTATDTVTVTVGNPPIANPGSSRTVEANNQTDVASVTLSGGGTADAGRTITGYQWTAPDGTTLTTQNLSLTLGLHANPPGQRTHTYTLRVRDSAGVTSAPVSVTITVTPTCPPSPADRLTVVQNGHWSFQGVSTVPAYGTNGDIPLLGDWDGNGSQTLGVYRPSTQKFALRNTNTTGIADITFQFGSAGDIPLAGDWDGVGGDTVGVYRPGEGRWYLRATNGETNPLLYASYQYGTVNETPVVGDWDGDGDDTPGIYRVSDGGWYLRNSHTTGFADWTRPFAVPSGQTPVVGQWQTGRDGVGRYNAANGQWRAYCLNGAEATYSHGGGSPVTGSN